MPFQLLGLLSHLPRLSPIHLAKASAHAIAFLGPAINFILITSPPSSEQGGAG